MKQKKLTSKATRRKEFITQVRLLVTLIMRVTMLNIIERENIL